MDTRKQLHAPQIALACFVLATRVTSPAFCFCLCLSCAALPAKHRTAHSAATTQRPLARSLEQLHAAACRRALDSTRSESRNEVTKQLLPVAAASNYQPSACRISMAARVRRHALMQTTAPVLISMSMPLGINSDLLHMPPPPLHRQ
jgi:hypothetical protein